MTYEGAWARYFAMTTLVELAVAAPVLGRESSWPRRILAVVVANFATHPFVWFFLARQGWPKLTLTLVAEPWALCFEAVVYGLVFTHIPRSRALAASALANGASFVAGMLLPRLY